MTHVPSYLILSTRTEFYRLNPILVPILAAARSRAWVCGCSPAEMMGSNPVGAMGVCFECCQVEVSATG
jgi:hypothetical protein